ncbi:hypothetical protein ACWEN3_37925 [Streptomyces sp. NPDC004561]
MLLRLTYLDATTSPSLLRLLPTSDRDKDIEILALRHQLLILQHQVSKPTFTDIDRAVLAGLLHQLPRQKLRQLLLLVGPDTIMRWHRKPARAMTCRHRVPKRRGHPPTVRSIRALVLRLAHENSAELFLMASDPAQSSTWVQPRAFAAAKAGGQGPGTRALHRIGRRLKVASRSSAVEKGATVLTDAHEWCTAQPRESARGAQLAWL